MITGKELLTELSAIKFGLQCIKGTGGHKCKPTRMNDEELNSAAEACLNAIMNSAIRLHAAEEVISRWMREAEYQGVVQNLVDAVGDAIREQQEGVDSEARKLRVVVKEKENP